MKKVMISAMAIMALLLGSAISNTAKAQIFLDDEDMNARINGTEAELPSVPTLGVTYDQYTPLGGEVLVLGLLGGAYLVGKKRKENA